MPLPFTRESLSECAERGEGEVGDDGMLEEEDIKGERGRMRGDTPVFEYSISPFSSSEDDVLEKAISSAISSSSSTSSVIVLKGSEEAAKAAPPSMSFNFDFSDLNVAFLRAPARAKRAGACPDPAFS